MRQIFMAVLLFVAVTTGLCPQEASGSIQEENKITAVSVTGLKRTKPHIIEKPLQKFIGMNAGTIDINEVFALVKSTGVLEPLSVDILDNQEKSGKTLAVTVREKWAIFPFPIVSINSKGWSAGGVLVDVNAFGLKDVMQVMGIFGTGDLTASVMYANTPDGIGEFGWNIMGFFSIKENENTDQTGEQTLRRYNSMSINPTIGLSYALSEHVTPSVNLSYKYIQLRDTENPINAPENGTHGITLSPNIGVHYNSWDGYFLNEKNVSLKYNYTLVIDDNDVHSVSLNAGFNHSIIPGFRFIAKGGMTFSTPSASPFFVSSPANMGVNILSGAYSANHFAGGSLGLEKHLFKFGAISLSTAYQAVYSHGDLLKHQFDHGVAAMAQVYFSGLALPAMSLGGAYNVDKNTWQFAFNIGMTF
jgi:outer membrane protein assembly factor BamA